MELLFKAKGNIKIGEDQFNSDIEMLNPSMTITSVALNLSNGTITVYAQFWESKHRVAVSVQVQNESADPMSLDSINMKHSLFETHDVFKHFKLQQ